MRCPEAGASTAHLLWGATNDSRNRWIIPRIFKVLKRPLLDQGPREAQQKPDLSRVGCAGYVASSISGQGR